MLEQKIQTGEVTEVEAQVYEDNAVKVIFYPIRPIPAHPEWTETYMVESRSSFEFLGFVGKLGWSHSYGYDDGLPGDRGKGRSKSRDEAIMKLVSLAEVDS